MKRDVDWRCWQLNDSTAKECTKTSFLWVDLMWKPSMLTIHAEMRMEATQIDYMERRAAESTCWKRKPSLSLFSSPFTPEAVKFAAKAKLQTSFLLCHDEAANIPQPTSILCVPTNAGNLRTDKDSDFRKGQQQLDDIRTRSNDNVRRGTVMRRS